MRKHLAAAALMSLIGTVPGLAQDVKPQTVGSFDTTGSITAGYRFIDVKGYKPKFTEIFGLRPGLRFHDASVSGRSSNHDNRFADSYSVKVSGFGGEPFSTGQFSLAKARRYDLRADFRQSYYYWNQNDQAIHPTGLHGLTNNHDWATVRKWGGVQFGVNATDNLQFRLEANRNSHSGLDFSTRTLDYFGSSATFQAFARANPYYVAAPTRDSGNRFTAGLSYSHDNWNLFYKIGYQTFEGNTRIENFTSPERSINVDDPTTSPEKLTQASWTESRKLRTPVSEFSYRGRPLGALQLRGGYIYYRYRGPAAMDAMLTGTARANTAGSSVGPYAITEHVRNELNEPNHVIDHGFSYELREWWRVHLDYRYARFSINSRGDLTSRSNLTGDTDGRTQNEWRYGLHIVDLALEFTPLPKVVFRPGIRLMKRDVTLLNDGNAEPQASLRSKIVSPIGSIYYSPSERLSLRGDLQSVTNGTPYTRITPRTDMTSRFLGRYQLAEKLSIENAFVLRSGSYATTEFRNSYRSNGITLTYALNDRYSAFGGFLYDSFSATAAITFLRGVAPLTSTWRDQTVNRVWQAGIDAKPTANIALRVNGNLLRTTGAGEISGEPPINGPIKWPAVTGTISYRFPRVGTVSIDLQRTYYIEQIMTGNNFGANVLGIRWTKEFKEE